MFYQRYPILKKNGMVKTQTTNPHNIFRSLPLKIYRNEMGGNNVKGKASNATIRNLSEQPGGTIISNKDPTISSQDFLEQNTVINSKDIIDGNSTNTVNRKCNSFSSKFDDYIVVRSRNRDSECFCNVTGKNVTRCLTETKSINREPYINKINNSVCLSTAGNALTRVRNRGVYNCGGGSGNIGYRPQYTQTKNVNSLVVVINNY